MSACRPDVLDQLAQPRVWGMVFYGGGPGPRSGGHVDCLGFGPRRASVTGVVPSNSANDAKRAVDAFGTVRSIKCASMCAEKNGALGNDAKNAKLAALRTTCGG